MKLITKLRRKNIYGDMTMIGDNELSWGNFLENRPLVQINIQGKLFGLVWITIKKVYYQ